MKNLETIGSALRAGGWFSQKGAYVLLDGQYGSTGKGLVASMLAQVADVLGFDQIVSCATTNAGPNSGHTSYTPRGQKLVLQQLPTFAAHMWYYGDRACIAHLNAGAVIDPVVLQRDLGGVSGLGASLWELVIHPLAAVIDDDAHKSEDGLSSKIGSTGKGVGAAIIRKIGRENGLVARSEPSLAPYTTAYAPFDGCVFVETAQGFDLSLNGPFYPFCTSRDCTVMQALSDARVHPNNYRQTMMVFRTYPIRVAGNSGGHWPDQHETSWEEIGQTPEITTVTKKIRRVFTWSRMQFRNAIHVNRPEHVFINFVQYIKDEQAQRSFIQQLVADYTQVMGRPPVTVVGGYGPLNADCRLEYAS